MTSNTVEIFDQKSTQDRVLNRGFRPELYTVENGTYVSNSSYGAEAPLTNSYLSNQLKKGTTVIPLIGAAGPPFVKSTEGCEIRQNGRDVDFSVSVCLNGNTDPNFGNEELRIKPRQRTFDQPPRYSIPFPLPCNELPTPTFKVAEILNKAGSPVAPDSGVATGTWVLGARILRDGTMALTKTNIDVAGSNEFPLLHADIDEGFTADNVIFVNVRGTYKAQTSRV